MVSHFVLGIGEKLYGVRASKEEPDSSSITGSMQSKLPHTRFKIDRQSCSPGSSYRIAHIQPAGRGSLIAGGVDWVAVDTLFADDQFWNSLDGSAASSLDALAAEIRDELASDEAGSGTLAGAYALQFVVLALRLRSRFLSSGRPWKEPEGVWSIDDVVRFIELKYTESFSLEWFVAQCAMNVTDFSRRFKERAGYPLFEFINRQRIARACALLKTSDLSILEISEAVGYNNLSFFNRYFLRIMGVSPRAYRGNRG